MICPKCQSDNVNVQIVNEAQLVKANHGCMWWIIIGWWWIPVKWIFLTVPALIFKIFGVGGKKKIVNIQKKMCVCQKCGHTWNA